MVHVQSDPSDAHTELVYTRDQPGFVQGGLVSTSYLWMVIAERFEFQ